MFDRFKIRSLELERLDTGDYTAAEYERWQREMPIIHRYWGEKRALASTLVADVRARKLEKLSILDVGSGSGSLLEMVRQEIADVQVFAAASELSDMGLRSAKCRGLSAVKADGLDLPFADHAFDYVMCSLLLHHLSDGGATQAIFEMNRVARLNFYAVDLNRHPVGYYGYKILSSFLFQKFTRDDGALSILRSFTPDELSSLAAKAGVSDPKVTHSRANRLVLSRR